MSTVEQLKSKLKFVDCILHELEGMQALTIRQQPNLPFLSGIRSTYKALQDWLRKQIVSSFALNKQNTSTTVTMFFQFFIKIQTVGTATKLSEPLK